MCLLLPLHRPKTPLLARVRAALERTRIEAACAPVASATTAIGLNNPPALSWRDAALLIQDESAEAIATDSAPASLGPVIVHCHDDLVLHTARVATSVEHAASVAISADSTSTSSPSGGNVHHVWCDPRVAGRPAAPANLPAVPAGMTAEQWAAMNGIPAATAAPSFVSPGVASASAKPARPVRPAARPATPPRSMSPSRALRMAATVASVANSVQAQALYRQPSSVYSVLPDTLAPPDNADKYAGKSCDPYASPLGKPIVDSAEIFGEPEVEEPSLAEQLFEHSFGSEHETYEAVAARFRTFDGLRDRPDLVHRIASLCKGIGKISPTGAKVSLTPIHLDLRPGYTDDDLRLSGTPRPIANKHGLERADRAMQIHQADRQRCPGPRYDGPQKHQPWWLSSDLCQAA